MSFHERHRFLVVAGLFEASLAVVAVVAGWALNVDPFKDLVWDARAFVAGAAAALPIFLLFAFAFHDPFLGMKTIRDLLLKLLGPPLAACRWYDLLLLATIAGVAEEVLFRGLLHPWLHRILASNGMALAISNLVFGVAHAITFLYAIAAGLIGAYLGWLMDVFGTRNLLIPMTTHVVYDFLAFAVVAHTYRESQRRAAEEAERNGTVVTRETTEQVDVEVETEYVTERVESERVETERTRTVE